MNPDLTPKTFFTALALAILLLIPWELYWRDVQGFKPGFDENAELWTRNRALVDKLSEEDIVILGSSRGHFDINIHLVDSMTGIRPVMLAIPGSSPYYIMQDIVEKTDFNGLLILSVAHGLFFSPPFARPAKWVKEERVDFFYKQSPASKFSQWVYMGIDPRLGYLTEEASYSKLVHFLPFPNRDSVEHEPIWPPMVVFDRYRNVRMLESMETDTVMQNRQKAIWKSFKGPPPDSATVAGVMQHYTRLAAQFKARGGRLAIICPPVTGYYLEGNRRVFPRDRFWDPLIEATGAVGYHFEDYPEMRAMNPPEWSHLNRREADIYTRMLVSLLRRDSLL